MLEPAQLNKFTSEIGFLPGTTDGHQGVGLPRRPAAQAVRRAAARPLRGLPAVAEVGRPGGREHLRRRDPEGDEGPGDAAAGRGRASPRRWTRSSPGEHRLRQPCRGARSRAPRPAAAGGVARAVARLTLPVLLLLPAMVDHRRRWSAIRWCGRSTCRSRTRGLGDLIYGGGDVGRAGQLQGGLHRRAPARRRWSTPSSSGPRA